MKSIYKIKLDVLNEVNSFVHKMHQDRTDNDFIEELGELNIVLRRFVHNY